MCGAAKLLPVAVIQLVVLPGDADVDPGRAELDGRLRVAVVDVGLLELVRGDRDHRGVRDGKLACGMLFAAVTSMTLLK